MTRFDFSRPRLIAYLTAGLPDEAGFLQLADAAVAAGVGVLEVGVPFSDPVADGPIIQAASERALEQGVRPPRALALAREVRLRHPMLPLVVMTYANVAYALGKHFTHAVHHADLDGVILADLPVDEIGTFPDLKDKLVLLAAPNTPEDRLARIAQATNGFLYLVGRFGVTGARDALARETVTALRRTVSAARPHGTPVAVGFGVSKPEHVRGLASAGADGVVVGSALMERVLADDVAGAAALLKTLAGALR